MVRDFESLRRSHLLNRISRADQLPLLAPRLHRRPAGDQRRGTLWAILEDLDQVMAVCAGEGREPSRHPKYPTLSVLATASGMPREAARTNTGGPFSGSCGSRRRVIIREVLTDGPVAEPRRANQRGHDSRRRGPR